MWRKSCRNFLFGLGALAAVLGPAMAVNRHELNGTWQLTPARSELNGEPAIQTGTVTIQDREGNIYVQRSFNFDGASHSSTTSFSTDARERASIKEPGFKSKAKWDGDVLKVATTQDGTNIVERYHLNTDGGMTLQIERTGHQPETLYFTRR